jgi:diaminohydroxyphosphoribosylaminopyrimidine deaminase / 5-amino-6-(5-phosphoribosylamino)uracil reductase
VDRDLAERAAMRRALDLARTPGIPLGPNPRVGAVLLAPDGTTLAEGVHRGAGTPHAEVDALARAGDRARGGTAVVTLEPCNHTGRTGPCAQALLEAGVTRVVFAQADPNPVAHGGAETLRDGGVDVAGGLLADDAREVNRAWTFSVLHRRPLVTWKLATTLDGRSAAADGTARWISSPPARRDGHRLRAGCDTILVGTGTVLVDDPQLTVRDDDDVDLPRERQPLRAVMGRREVPSGRRVLDAAAGTVVLATRDPHEALAALHARGRQHVLLEGGPTLAAAFLTAGLVDEAVAYVAPMLLGSGLAAVGDLGVATIADAVRLELVDTSVLGDGPDANVRLTLRPSHPAPCASPDRRRG